MVAKRLANTSAATGVLLCGGSDCRYSSSSSLYLLDIDLPGMDFDAHLPKFLPPARSRIICLPPGLRAP
jgi:hypothetical protein